MAHLARRAACEPLHRPAIFEVHRGTFGGYEV